MTQLDILIRLHHVTCNLTIASKDYELHKVSLVRFVVLSCETRSLLSIRRI